MSNPFTYGGSLPNHSQTYLQRCADEEAFQALSQGIYCYILNSRQTGKSSLGISTFSRLMDQDILAIWIDLSLQDTTHSQPESWYLNFIDLLNFGAGLNLDIDDWWEQFPNRTGFNRLQKYIDTVLLVHVTQPIVIFIDEIDTVLSLPFSTDDFFALIRACFNLRAIQPRYQHLTFCLMGVASPNDLIQDPQRTPFNIGQKISLTGFQLAETQNLQQFFQPHFDQPQALLQEILHWTGGQPFLTQKLCALAYESIKQAHYSSIADLVHTKVLNRWEVHDDPQHLHTIQKRLIQNDEFKSRRLELLETLHLQPDIPSTGAAAEVSLLLSGIAIEHDRGIRLCNPIYREIFSLDWLRHELSHYRPYHDAIAAWLESDKQDSQWLLDSEQLQSAQTWSQDKTLGEVDYLFLNASQNAERLKANQAEQQAQRNYQRSKKILGCSVIVSGLLAIGTVILGGFTAQKFQQVNLRDSLTEQSSYALREFEAQREIDALLIALEAGFDLKGSVTKTTLLRHYPSVLPIRTLNHIHDHIREYRFTHTAPILDAMFSPDGQTVATASQDHTARLWTREGKLIQEFKGHQKKVISVNFDAIGEHLITGSADSTAKLWQLDGTLKTTFKYPKRVQSVQFSPTQQYLLTSSLGQAFWLRKLPDQLTRIPGHTQRIRYVTFDPTGTQILTVSDDQTAKLWDLNGESQQTFQGHEGVVTHGVFSPDGQNILTTSADKSAILWDLRGNPLQRFQGHFGWIEGGDISPDGHSILTASRDRTVKHWSRGGLLLQEYTGFQDRLYHASFSPTGQQILTVSHGPVANIWDLDRTPQNTILDLEEAIRRIEYHPQGSSILLTSNHTAFRELTPSGQLIREIEGHTNSVWTAQFNSAGTQIASASADHTARLWGATGEPLQAFIGHQDAVMDVTFSPDDRMILTGSQDQTAILWNLDGTRQHIFKGHGDAVRSVSFSPDGKKIVTASMDGTVRLWQTNGQLLQIFEAHTAPVRSVVFNGRGDRILTAADDQTAKLWSLDGKVVREFVGHGNRVWSARFSPDGEKIVTASSDRTARIWDLNGNEIQVFKAHQGSVQYAAFNPAGSQVITVSDDTTARGWEVRTLAGLLNWGCDRVRGYLEADINAKPKYLEMCNVRRSP